MNAPSADAKRSIAEVEKTVVSLPGLRMDYRTLSKTPGTGNWCDARVIIDPPGPPSYLCRMSTVCPKLITLLFTLVLLGLVPPGGGTVQGAPASTSE